jgi:hypothetical protein
MRRAAKAGAAADEPLPTLGVRAVLGRLFHADAMRRLAAGRPDAYAVVLRRSRVEARVGRAWSMTACRSA